MFAWEASQMRPVAVSRGQILAILVLGTRSISTVCEVPRKGQERLRPRFFFHEHGRRVGMVPRSSLKEGKNSQMVEKRTKTTQQPNNRKPQPTGRVSTIL